jgi:hypothetical protein
MYAIHQETAEILLRFSMEGHNQEEKVNTGNILSVAYQIAAIVASIAFLYGIQRFMSKPIEGDEEKRATMEKARALRREARYRSIELLKASSESDFFLGTASSTIGKDEQARGSRKTLKRHSREEELRSSVTELSGKRAMASGETQGSWGTAQGCG